VEVRGRLGRMSEKLDPVTLLRNIRARQQRLAEIVLGNNLSEAPYIESFLRSLRIASTEGEVRPTAKAKPKLKRERRRPDPLVNVTNDLYRWFEAERLQSIYPREYPDGLIRTVQQRVKGWRRDRAHGMIIGNEPGEDEQLSALSRAQ